MNLEERFKSWGKGSPTRGSAKPTETSPDELLFAATEVAASTAPPNPYGDDNEFDDGFGAEGTSGSMGPCMFEGPGIAERPPADLVRFYEDVRHPPVDDDDDEGLANLLQLDSAEARPSGLQIGPPPIPMGAATNAKARAASLRPDVTKPGATPARIPGRDRVSYSQQHAPNAPRNPVTGVAAKDGAGVSTKLRTPASAWLLACTWIGAGIGIGSYVGFVLGSPVLGSVTFTLGLIAAMFSVVLLRR